MIVFNEKERQYIEDNIKIIYKGHRFVSMKTTVKDVLQNTLVEEDNSRTEYDDDEHGEFQPCFRCIMCDKKNAFVGGFEMIEFNWDYDDDIVPKSIKEHIIEEHFELLDNEDQNKFEEIFERDGWVDIEQMW